jgi:hypothetical protein
MPSIRSLLPENGTIAVHRSDRDYALLAITAPAGTMIAEPGDWIIRGVKGELYPCKPDIFESTYAATPNSVGSGVMTDGQVEGSKGALLDLLLGYGDLLAEGQLSPDLGYIGTEIG